MSMPQIPEGKYRPSLEETVIDLLESIALEEIAISHLLNAEAEKNQALVCKLFHDDRHSLFSELAECNKATCKIIDTVIIEEWLLLKKLETVLEIDYCCKEKHGKCEGKCEEKYERKYKCEGKCECKCKCKNSEGW